MTALVVKNASKQFGKINSVDNVSLELNPGTITVLLGGSGAGKSTLLRLIAGLETLDEGVIQYGSDLWSDQRTCLPPEDRRVGLIFQDFALFPHMTVVENVSFAIPKQKKIKSKEIAHTWLERVELEKFANAYPNTLSGGQRQRVALARTFASEPQILLMDEPFSGLDPARREFIRDYAIELARNSHLPTLLVTHDYRDAVIAADTLAIMENGQIIQKGSPAEIYFHPKSISVAATLGPVNVFSSIIEANNKVKTPFGNFEESRYPRGTRVNVIVREDAISLGSKLTAEVIDARNIGRFTRLTLQSKDEQFYASCEVDRRLKVGDQINIDVDLDGVFIFLDSNC